jgi:signal transduction histidine kinase
MNWVEFIDGPIPGARLLATHDPGLVMLSYVVACFAAYTAMDFAGRVVETCATPRAARRWLTGGACAMGTGIWGMHFIAMLAYRIPIPVHYDAGITVFSLAVGILLSGFALKVVTRASLPVPRLLAGGAVMGLGVVIMHYTGMAAMRMNAAMLYDPFLFALSVANALVCSTIALWLVFRVGAQARDGGHLRYRIAAAVFMGLAICGMHFTAIVASVCVAPQVVSHAAIPVDPLLQTLVIAGVSVLFISVILVVSHQNRIAAVQLKRQNAELLNEIAERRRVETALTVAIRQAAEANRAKSEFLANMSHELRTPMHAIASFAKLGVTRGRDAQRDKIVHYFSNINASAARLMALLNDLLDLSKIEAGKLRLEFASSDTRSMALEVLAEFEAMVRSRDVVLESHFETPLPQADIDVLRMQQVIRNLVSNAIKFSPAGGRVLLSVTAQEADSEREGPALQFTVRDEGPGIPLDELELVFDKFEQSSRTKSGAGGTGLGLAIAREIVTAHGGRICVRNRQPVGAEFIVTIPFYRQPEDDAGSCLEQAAA